MMLFYNITGNKKWTTYLYAAVFLPGTFIHEMAHFIFALFLFVPVGNIKLLPVIEDKKIKLGSVNVGKTDIFRRFMVGSAPFVAGVSLIFFIIQVAIRNEFALLSWGTFFSGALIFEIANTMFLSKSDLKGAIQLLIFLTIVYSILYLLGFRISYEFYNFLFSGRVVSLIKLANLYLMAPIFIDIFGLTFLKLLKT